ncbi:DNA/RNA non-specific endonuclease [Mesorhizobium sp. Cs1299R1N1]|uniref:DNA/RNA non-specific endonuclease n=1 Tax=Mesorhizobium sp. Cs1299R1N1 TaxID=3015172 RepID=UPI00301C52E2
MTSPATDADLRAFLAGTTRSNSIDEVVAESRMLSAGRLESAGAEATSTDTALTRMTLEKLARGQALDPRERYHLEAIIIPDKRPAIDIVRGDFTTRHPDWLFLNDTDVKGRLKALFPSIGRIELPNHPTAPYGGTGFVVGPNLLMTNRHVAEIFASGMGRNGLKFVAGLEAGIDFLKERGSTEAAYLRVVRVTMIHPHWDMALLIVDGLPSNRSPLRLSTTDPETLRGRDVVVVGYPTFDVRNPAGVQNDVFAGVYGIKRLQPGKLKGIAPVEAYYGRVVDAGLHDSSTLGGNSGSCVIDPRTGEVVGLHFGGVYAVTNYYVPAGALAQDGCVIDAGPVFSGPVSRRSTRWDDAWQEIEAAETSAGSVPAVQPPVPSPTKTSRQSTPTPTGPPAMETKIVIPLEITVRLGQAQPVPPGGDLSPTPAPTMEDTGQPVVVERALEPVHDTDYSTRKGYDPNFLGVAVPLPRPRRLDQLALMADGGFVIPYNHFSIVMHKVRRLALLCAANVSVDPKRKRPGNRPDKDYQRDGLGGLGEHDTEKWFGDPRILGTEQLPDKFYNQDRKSFDKGHIVRREDVAWGDTYEEMRNANGDTFHVTNCSPQTASFNRPNEAAENWGALENLVLANAKTENLVVFGGPILAEGDLMFRGVDTEGKVVVAVPRKFWKVIVARKENRLQSFAFLLEQDLSGVVVEMAVPDKWRQHMVSVAEIEELAGIDFSRAVREGDQLGTTEGVTVRGKAGIAGPAQASEEAPGSAPDLVVGDITAFWREQQKSREPSVHDVRFVIALATPLSDEVIRDQVGGALELNVRVGPLFAPDRDLDRFRALDIPGVVAEDRSDLFDIARFINTLLGSETAEPDLSTNYFDDGSNASAPEGSAESSDFAFWCWVDETKSSPTDPDWALNKTSVRKAWAFSSAAGRPSGGKGILVFQPDTGVVPTQTELPPNIVRSKLAGNMIEVGKPPIDPMKGSGNVGHGTSTASVVASPQAGAMSGSAPQATLVPIRCITSVAVFDQSRIAQAIDHARLNGAHVITMSLGGVFSSALHAAVRKAVQANIIVVAAAGNCVFTVVWPARYDEVIAVGGINEQFQPWKGSSRGETVDISGPAELVMRADARDLVNNGKVGPGQGTSYATAHLAGVAACWLAHHGRDALIGQLAPGRTLQSLFKATIQLSADVPAGFDTGHYGAGIVNADALLRRKPEFAGAPETVAIARSTVDQVRDLLAEVAASGQVEAIAPTLEDKQNLLELACLALDTARATQARAGKIEAMPPRLVSRSLRARLGDDFRSWTDLGASDGR